MKDIQKIGTRTFRYDRSRQVVQRVIEAYPEMIEDNREWRETFGKDLWEIVEGYVVTNERPLALSEWEDPKSRDELLSEWVSESRLRESKILAEAVSDYIKGGNSVCLSSSF